MSFILRCTHIGPVAWKIDGWKTVWWFWQWISGGRTGLLMQSKSQLHTSC